MHVPQADVPAAPASGQTLGTVSAGDRLNVTGVTGSQLYYRVDYRGQTGLIFHSYVTVEGNLDSVPIAEP